jgi:hypothetical protein
MSRYSVDSSLKNNGWSLIEAILLTSIIALFFNAMQLVNSVENKNRNSVNMLANQLAFGLILLFTVVLLSQSWFSIPQAVLRMYGLADVENVRIVFNKNECEVLTQFEVKYIFKPDSNICTINHGTILSAVGSDYYIASEDGKKFALPQHSANVVRLPRSTVQMKIKRIRTAVNEKLHQVSYSILNNGKTIEKATLTFNFYSKEKGLKCKKF